MATLNKLKIIRESFDRFNKKFLDADEVIIVLDAIIKLESSKNKNKISDSQLLCEKAKESIKNG